MNPYDSAFVTVDQVEKAINVWVGCLAHEDMVDLLEWIKRERRTEMPWFRMSDTQRDILTVAGIRPQFRNENGIIQELR
jgi:hypothetical protein